MESRLPKLREAVDRLIEREAEGHEIEGILIGLDAFAGEPTLLYNALWYVTSRGVGVVIAGQEPEGAGPHMPESAILTAND